jgi:hypothetical protein
VLSDHTDQHVQEFNYLISQDAGGKVPPVLPKFNRKISSAGFGPSRWGFSAYLPPQRFDAFRPEIVPVAAAHWSVSSASATDTTIASNASA